jgi:hypothetical protein
MVKRTAGQQLRNQRARPEVCSRKTKTPHAESASLLEGIWTWVALRRGGQASAAWVWVCCALRAGSWLEGIGILDPCGGRRKKGGHDTEKFTGARHAHQGLNRPWVECGEGGREGDFPVAGKGALGASAHQEGSEHPGPMGDLGRSPRRQGGQELLAWQGVHHSVEQHVCFQNAIHSVSHEPRACGRDV